MACRTQTSIDRSEQCFCRKNWDSLVLDWDSRFFARSVPGLTITICNKIIAFVRTHPNLGVPVVQSHKFSKNRGRPPISRTHWFYQGHLGRETGLLSTRYRFRKWRTRIRNQWLPLVHKLSTIKFNLEESAAKSTRDCIQPELFTRYREWEKMNQNKH